MSMEMVLGLIPRHPSDVPAVWRLFLNECGSPILSLPVFRFPGGTSISDQISTPDLPDLPSSLLLFATFLLVTFTTYMSPFPISNN